MARHFIDIQDWTQEEILDLLKEAQALKANPVQTILPGKTLGLLFTKSSTRTRVSFEVGMSQLGGHSIFLDVQGLQISRGETLADTARVLTRYLDGMVIRTYEHKELVEFAKFAGIPVINGLTDDSHPCQILSDLLTIYERTGEIRNIRLTYAGDGANNVAHTWLFAAAILGMKLTIAAPQNYWPDPDFVRAAVKFSKSGSSFLEVTQDIRSAVQYADVLYTDVWVSMGQESERADRLKALKPYQVNTELLRRSPGKIMVMHCLPAHRGEEITDEAADGPNSVIFDQAENRLHAQKALLVKLIRQ